VPNHTVLNIPPAIRLGSCSKVPSGEVIWLENARYGMGSAVGLIILVLLERSIGAAICI
jgi:hypothetical protein